MAAFFAPQPTAAIPWTIEAIIGACIKNPVCLTELRQTVGGLIGFAGAGFSAQALTMAINGNGSGNNRKCTEEQHQSLQNAVEEACNNWLLSQECKGI
jgi:hypothetical protein